MERYTVVYDLEYTAWEGSLERRWTGAGEYKEIIQIGAVLVTRDTFEEIDSFSLLVKPERNPVLSPYISALTGITQDRIGSEGRSFEEALMLFSQWVAGRDMYAWGADGSVVALNCELYGVTSPFKESQFINCKPLFARYGIVVKNYMSSTIVEAFGKKSPYTGHDGLNDARSIVLGFRELQQLHPSFVLE